MKIGFDISPVQRWDNRFRGIGCYIYNLVENLISIDSKNEYIFFTFKKSNGENGVKSWFSELKNRAKTNLKFLEISRSSSLLNRFLLSREVTRHKIDIFHFPVQLNLPWVRFYKSIVTIHDLIPFLFSKDYLPGMRDKLFYFLEMKINCGAPMIIAVSKSTKKDIIKLFGVPEDKIRVIYNGKKESFKPIKDRALLDKIKAQYSINGEFLMYVGGADKRKNISRMLKAFQAFKVRSPNNLKLSVVGKINIDELKKTIRNESLFTDVIFTDYVNEEDLILLYNASEFVIFPSLYEGFGLPAVEAMACGKAVITSNNSSLPEVVGNAGLYINPRSEDEITETIHLLWRDKSLREKLGEKGIKRARMFGWKKTALQTLRVYKELGTIMR